MLKTMQTLIPLSIRLPPPLMASFISRFIEKSKNKGNPLESCLLLRRLQTYVKMRANMFNCTRFPFKCSFADFLSNIHLRIFLRIFFRGLSHLKRFFVDFLSKIFSQIFCRIFFRGFSFKYTFTDFISSIVSRILFRIFFRGFYFEYSFAFERK